MFPAQHIQIAKLYKYVNQNKPIKLKISAHTRDIIYHDDHVNTQIQTH